MEAPPCDSCLTIAVPPEIPKPMNLRLLIVAVLCLASPNAIASLYGYPEDKQPEITLSRACQIAESLLAKLGHGQGYYAYGVSLLGDKKQTGAGAWTLMYRNIKGDQIRFGIYFPEDRCFVAESPKDGTYTEKEYTRDGRVSPKWIEWQEELRKDREESEKTFGPAESDEEKKKTGQDGAGQPATRPGSP